MQPPFTTRQCLNVLPEEGVDGRDRGGSRPGLNKDYIYTKFTGTVDGTPAKDNGTSTITATTAVFDETVVGGTITFDTSSNGYVVSSYTSTTIIVVTGDASGEAADDTFVFTGGGKPVAIGSGNPVNMLASVRKVGSAGPGKFIQDDFTNEDAGTPDTDYWDNSETTSSWGDGYEANLDVDTTNYYLQNSDTSGNRKEGLVLIASGGAGEFVGTGDINWAEPVRVIASGADNDGTHGAALHRKFEYYFFMDSGANTNPLDEGIVVGFAYEAAGSLQTKCTVTIEEYWGGSIVSAKENTPHFSIDHIPGHEITIKSVLVDSSGARKFQIQAKAESGVGPLWLFGTDHGWNVSRWHRIGVSMGGNHVSYSPNAVLSDFSLHYSSAAHATLPSEVIVASANGTAYREELTLGTVDEIGTDSANGIEYAQTVSTRQRLGKLYIADYDLLSDQTGTGDNPVITDATGILTHAGQNFTTLGVTTVDRIDITNASNTLAIGTWKISAVAPGADNTKLTIADWLTLGGDVSSVKYRILCGPKVYDPSTDTLSAWHNTTRTANDAMAIPIACRIVSSYKDRMVLAGDDTGVVYLSRAGDPDDWDFSASNTDEERAIGLGAATSDIAGLPEAVTAVIPHTDDYLLLASKNTFWVLRGDPGSGGVLDNLSHDVGCISRFAWCRDPEGNAYILTTNGIYHQPAGATVSPQKLSKHLIPQSLLGIDLEVIEPFLVYSLEYDGVFIFLAPKSTRPMDSWFFDSESAGFFPVQYNNQNHHPRSVLSYKPETQAFTKVLFGGKDGFIRSIGGTTDDGGTIASRCVIGPIRLGVRGGFVKELRAVLAENSGDVYWSLTTGDSEEGTLTTTPVVNGTWSEGHNYMNRPNVVGRAAYLNLFSPNQWAMEVVEARIEPARGHLPL
jgi:hypothetical protein